MFTPVLNTFYEFNLAFDLAAASIGRKIRFGVIRFGVGVDKTKCWTSWICFTFVTFIPWIYSFEVLWEVIFTESTYFSFSFSFFSGNSQVNHVVAEIDGYGHDSGQKTSQQTRARTSDFFRFGSLIWAGTRTGTKLWLQKRTRVRIRAFWHRTRIQTGIRIRTNSLVSDRGLRSFEL